MLNLLLVIKQFISVAHEMVEYNNYCPVLLESLSNSRRRRQRECHQTKGLMSKTIAVHVRYESLYISTVLCKTTT